MALAIAAADGNIRRPDFAVQELDFDSKLFGFKVGRLNLATLGSSSAKGAGLSPEDPEDVATRALATANDQGFRLVYIFGPVTKFDTQSTDGASQKVPKAGSVDEVPLPGFRVDCKTTYSMSGSLLESWRRDAALEVAAFEAQENRPYRVETLRRTSDPPSPGLLKLAFDAGVWSRFKVDPLLSDANFEAMYTKIMENSINGTIADVVWVVYAAGTNKEIGFLTAKLKDGGKTGVACFLVVAHEYRRHGIAKMLFYTMVNWLTPEVTRFEYDTQIRNETARKMYDMLGFRVEAEQTVHHAWLPHHLLVPNSVADKNPIRFCKQYVAERQMQYVKQVMETGLDSSGQFTYMAINLLKNTLGPDCERVVLTPSGTAALEMAAILCDLQPGDEVIMPSYTFPSTANAFVLRGAVPVFVDIRRDTLNIDELLIEQAINSKTRAICVVHYAGIPCEMDTICAIAGRFGLKVIEDAAQGFWSTYKGRQLGTIGDFGCFSFHYTKNVICGEGGALSVNRCPELAKRALVIQEKGTNRHDFVSGKADKYEWVDVGSSFVPSEVACAILAAQLEMAAPLTEARLDNFRYYTGNLSGLAAAGYFRIPEVPDRCTGNGHIFFLVFPSSALRDQCAAKLDQAGVTAFKHYVPLHSSPAGQKFGRVAGKMDVTEETHEGLLRLPVWVGLQKEQLELVVSTIKSFVKTVTKI